MNVVVHMDKNNLLSKNICIWFLLYVKEKKKLVMGIKLISDLINCGLKDICNLLFGKKILLFRLYFLLWWL